MQRREDAADGLASFRRAPRVKSTFQSRDSILRYNIKGRNLFFSAPNEIPVTSRHPLGTMKQILRDAADFEQHTGSTMVSKVKYIKELKSALAVNMFRAARSQQLRRAIIRTVAAAHSSETDGERPSRE